MRANGTGMLLKRVDGEENIDTYISGYKTGIDFEPASNGNTGATYYNGSISNCATPIFVQSIAIASGVAFTQMRLDGDIAVHRNSTPEQCAVQFSNCTSAPNGG